MAYKIDYNGIQFEITASLTYKDNKIVALLDKDNINSIIIVRDIKNHFHHIKLNIRDKGNLFAFNVLPDGNWKLQLSIFQNAEQAFGLSEDDMTVAYEFIVDNVKPEFLSPEYSTVTISATDPIVQTFLKSVSFATQTYEDRSSLIESLLKSAGFIKTGTIDKCNIKDTYITDNNSSLLSHVEFLLNKVYSPDLGFLFFYHDYKKNEFKWVWSNKALKDIPSNTSSGKDAQKLLKISGNDEFKHADYQTVTSSIIYNLNDLKTTSRQFINTEIQTFDLKKPKVEVKNSNKFEYKFFEDLAKYPEGKSMIPTIFPKDALKVGLTALFDKAKGNVYNISSEDVFIKEIRDAYINNNMICLYVPGVISRPIGEVYMVEAIQNPVIMKLNGPWLCTKIVDEFKNGQYNQYIFLIRPGEEFVDTQIKERLSKLGRGQ
jgi:hypothetical protein